MAVAVRMTHPDHGATHAYETAEVKKLETLGWQRQSEDDFKALIEAKTPKRGPGRPAKAE